MTKTNPESFIVILIKDVSFALARKESADNQATRRDFIRTAFSAIEGMVWIFREEVIDAAESTYGLEDGEKIVLEERQFSVSEQGRITPQTRYLTLPTTIRLVARIASRISAIEHFDFGSKEWENFREAIAIRNRITHPKSAKDLHIEEGDVEKVTNALFWFLGIHAEVLEQTVVTRKKYLSELDDVMGKLKAGDPDMIALYNAVRDREN